MWQTKFYIHIKKWTIIVLCVSVSIFLDSKWGDSGPKDGGHPVNLICS
jgi:hypothetical protein